MYSDMDKKTIQHQFDSFCKKILKYRARDYYRKQKKQFIREVSLDSVLLSEIEELLSIPDCTQEIQCFTVCGEEVTVTDEALFEGLESLPEDRREIVLLSYFIGLSDREIAEKLKCVRRTVAHRRLTAQKMLKKMMEDSLIDE